MDTKTSEYDLACEANDAYRRMRMNVKYYGLRLAQLQRWNLGIEIAIAVGTSGTVASLAVWNTPWGKILFATLAGIAAFLGVIKPILNLAAKISRYSKLWSSYNGLHFTLDRIARDIRLNHALRPELADSLNAALEGTQRLASEEDPAPCPKLLAKALAETNVELPIDRLWWPKGCEPKSLDVAAVGTATAHAGA